MFTLEIKMGNDAMQTPSAIAEALRRVAGVLRDSSAFDVGDHGQVQDMNGNTVGKWEYRPEA